MGNIRSHAAGRGSAIRPPSRFDTTTRVLALDVIEGAEENELADRSNPATAFIADSTRSVVTTNDSPDVGFRFSLNPYRGCEHGCAYCYARPGHETLGMNAGIDFETKVLVKHHAVELFRRELNN